MSNRYCSVVQLKRYLDLRAANELSDDTDQGAADATVQQEMLDAAASELDSYLQGRYPLTGTVPPVLTRWVACKTADLLFGRRGKTPEGVQKDVSWAEKWIDLIVSGKASVPGLSRETMAIQQASSGDPMRSRFDNIAYFDQSVPGGTGTPED